jgi:DNA-binding NarL/FixJ family response regulator
MISPMPQASSTGSAIGSTTDWMRIAIVSPNMFISNLLEHTLRSTGITTLAQSAHASAATSLVGTADNVDVLLRVVAIEDDEIDLLELHAVRSVRPSIGLVVLTLARDIRLLGLTPESLPVGTRVVSTKDADSRARLSDVIESAARNPLASQRHHARLPLTDEQVVALRAVASGLSNTQFAAERSTTLSAARQIVNRTARALGIPTTTSPSQMRAMMGANYVRLLGGAEIARRRLNAT